MGQDQILRGQTGSGRTGNTPSKNHYLTNLVHYLHLGAEEGRNVGTVVLTDFS